MNPAFDAVCGGCDGDRAGLLVALGDGFEVLFTGGDYGGWGHHSANSTFKTADGKFVHANCGGCSCGGTGDWRYCDSEADAMRYVPEQERPGG